MMTCRLKNLRLKFLQAKLVAAAMVAGMTIFASPAMAYVGTPDDLTQMQQLLAAYSNALDGEDPDGYAGVFTARASWHSPTRCFTGHEQIRKLGADANVRFRGPNGNPPGQYPVSHMTVLGHVIFDDANHAHSHETNILVGSQGYVVPLKGGADIFYTGYYNDTFERQPNGRWLISDRDENSGADPVTGIHDEKYHPPRVCPPDPPGTAPTSQASIDAVLAAGKVKPAGYLGTADDFAQMQQLLATYANSLDGDNPAGYASVFTPNAHWQGMTLGCHVGHAALMKLAQGESDRLAKPGQFPHSHMTTLGHVVFDDKNHAHAHETNILVGSQGFVVALKGGAGLFYTGHYNDTFERQPDGRWLFSARDESDLDETYRPPRACPAGTTD